jgi:hypothetical protein
MDNFFDEIVHPVLKHGTFIFPSKMCIPFSGGKFILYNGKNYR